MEEGLLESETVLNVSRFLSYTVVIISVFMKLPQISTLLASGSAEGVNLRSYWLEIGAYLIGFFYGYTYDYHISIYAEAGLLALQDVIIIALVMNHNKKWTLENALYIFLAASFIIASLCKVVPHPVLDVLLSSTLPLAVSSKVGQIRTIYQLKSRGDVSVFTWALATYGCVARIFTAFVEVGDLQILMNFCVSALLNSIVVALCLYYGKEIKKSD